MTTDLKGKAVLITGASTGIGAAAARAFAGDGARVVIHYNASRDAARGGGSGHQGKGRRRGAGRRRCHGRGRRQAHRRRSASRHSAAIDVLINNAGGMLGRMKIEDYTVEHIDRVLALNCTQVALFMREVVPLMRRQKSAT